MGVTRSKSLMKLLGDLKQTILDERDDRLVDDDEVPQDKPEDSEDNEEAFEQDELGEAELEEFRQMRQMVQDLLKENEGLKAAAKQARLDHQSLMHELDVSAVESREKEAEIEIVQSKIDGLTKTIQCLEKDRATLQDSITKTRQDRERDFSEITRLRDQVNALQGKLDAEQLTNAELSDKLKEAEAQVRVTSILFLFLFRFSFHCCPASFAKVFRLSQSQQELANSRVTPRGGSDGGLAGLLDKLTETQLQLGDALRDKSALAEKCRQQQATIRKLESTSSHPPPSPSGSGAPVVPPVELPRERSESILDDVIDILTFRRFREDAPKEQVKK
eukprot:c14554_g1_i2.p1 GENE.c14554_g1_i2~~c14554_g1_i2.p1  ORF type:complete len:357 (-),score=102.23 c14554_g1_i2:22-1020(-)